MLLELDGIKGQKRKCKGCGVDFEKTARGAQVFCTNKCRISFYNLFPPKLKEPYTKSCLRCRVNFLTTCNDKLYCSKECLERKRQEDRAYDKDVKVINTSAVGTVHELKVALDLYRRGYEVFKALDGSASCDLIAVKQKELIRVQVTKGRKNPRTGTILFPKHKQDTYDLLAISFDGNEIIYDPTFKD